MTPGPTPVPPEVLAAMAQPVVHHRTPDFRPVYRRVLDRLGEAFRTEDDVLLFPSSGSGAMDAVLANLGGPGVRALVVSAGYFGERWGQIAAVHECDVEWLRYEWGETPTADDLRARLQELGGVDLVLLTQSETSTGVVCDIRALAEVAREARGADRAASTSTGSGRARPRRRWTRRTRRRCRSLPGSTSRSGSCSRK